MTAPSCRGSLPIIVLTGCLGVAGWQTAGADQLRVEKQITAYRLPPGMAPP
jgi:hypothetical protein